MVYYIGQHPKSCLLRVLTVSVWLIAVCLAGATADGVACAAESDVAEELRPLRVAYFAPSDVEPHADYAQRLTRVMLNIQEFYRDGMRKNGFGNLTFPLSLAEDGTVQIVVVKGERPLLVYHRNSKDTKNAIREEVGREFSKQGLDFDREVVIVFQALLQVEPNKTTEIGPFIGGGNWFKGSALVYDDPRLDPQYLSSNQPDPHAEGGKTLGDFNTGYIGGAAHELGHAFGIGHDAESELVRPRMGRSLMGRGNHDYGEELRGKNRGVFLSAASAFPTRCIPCSLKNPSKRKKPTLSSKSYELFQCEADCACSARFAAISRRWAWSPLMIPPATRPTTTPLAGQRKSRQPVTSPSPSPG